MLEVNLTEYAEFLNEMSNDKLQITNEEEVEL